MLIITSSKSVPKIPSQTNEKLALKLPSIIQEKRQLEISYQSNNVSSMGTSKKLRVSKNQNLSKEFTQNDSKSSSIGMKNLNEKRKSLLQNSVCKPSRSMKKESVKTNSQQLYRLVNKLICLDYGVLIDDKISSSQSIKGVIEKGNNSLLVRQILKCRGYWNIKPTVQEDDNSNSLIWTQFRKKNVISYKPTRQQCQSKKLEINKSLKSSVLELTNIFKLFIMPDDSRQNFTTSDIIETFKKIISNQNIINLQPKNLKLTNHLPQQHQLSNKKSLFQNLFAYYNAKNMNPFEYIPVTFHLASSISSPQFQKFRQFAQNQPKKNNLWIIKPGQFTNRGNGIKVEKGVQGVKSHLQSFKSKHTYLVQSYIRPYLYCQRKFDIRCYLLVIMMNNSIKGYWYEQGYIRTSSEPFSYKKMDKMIHLTNDAIQKHGQNYGKFQQGNKISYIQLQKYIQKQNKKSFTKQIVPKMRQLAKDALQSTKGKLGAQRNEQAFEIYGIDYMLDQDLNPWLIQFNTNPCLQTGSSLLSRIIPDMLENAFRIALDPFLFDSKRKITPSYQSFLKNNKFQIIFKD